MKIWIVGTQGTYKKEIAKLLSDDKFKVAKLFTNALPTDNIYHKDMYNFYESSDIQGIFENGAYIFMNDVCDKIGIQEGLEFNDYDSCNVFVLTIDQFNALNVKYVSKGDLVVWLDGGNIWRFHNIDRNEDYNIKNREELEKSCYQAFGTMINSIKTSFKNVIYFYEETPERVKTIIKTIYNNPKLKDEFVKNFS